MAQIYLDKNNEFTVKEWKVLNWVAGIVFFVLFIAMIIAGAWFYALLFGLPFLLLPALKHRKQAAFDGVIIRVNSNGIFYYGKHITDWDNFLNAYVTNEMKVRSFKDNFELVLEFYRDTLLIQKKIKLTNTQNRSEEEVYGAIMYFYKQHLNADVETIDAEAEVVTSK